MVKVFNVIVVVFCKLLEYDDWCVEDVMYIFMCVREIEGDGKMMKFVCIKVVVYVVKMKQVVFDVDCFVWVGYIFDKQFVKLKKGKLIVLGKEGDIGVGQIVCGIVMKQL